MILFETWDEMTLPSFPEDTETKGALEAIKWAYDHYGDKLVYACSFGIEGIVMIELISRINPHARIIFLDTNYHFKETYDVIEKVKLRYPDLDIHMQQPELTLDEQTQLFGPDLFRRDANKCCELRKVKPLEKAIGPSYAWISGLRREQSELRSKTNYLNVDNRFKKIKVCPLIHWTWKDIWRFAHKEKLDYNVLHDQGYPSIGCEPCTEPTISADDFRGGRWSGQGKTECGLHDGK